MPLALTLTTRVNPQRPKTANFAGNCPRTRRDRNLSFSLPSLLALALAAVRISQATTKPRLISLPTNHCGFIARAGAASTQAAWLRMGTEGTGTVGAAPAVLPGQVPGSVCRGDGRARRAHARELRLPLTAGGYRNWSFPSLTCLKPTHLARGSGKNLRLQPSFAGTVFANERSPPLFNVSQSSLCRVAFSDGVVSPV